jgi:citronellyl-CoA dehydrogenase
LPVITSPAWRFRNGRGSDVASLKTTAKRVAGDWVINGGKMWTTNGTQADWMCLLANTGEGAVHKNKSLIACR